MLHQKVKPFPRCHGELRGVSYEQTKQGSIPLGVGSLKSGTPSPPVNGHDRDPMLQASHAQSSKPISAPKNAQVIQDAEAWGNRQNLLAPQATDDKKQKKRSFFGFGTKPRVSIDFQDTGANDSS